MSPNFHFDLPVDILRVEGVEREQKKSKINFSLSTVFYTLCFSLLRRFIEPYRKIRALKPFTVKNTEKKSTMKVHRWDKKEASTIASTLIIQCWILVVEFLSSSFYFHFKSTNLREKIGEICASWAMSLTVFLQFPSHSQGIFLPDSAFVAYGNFNGEKSRWVIIQFYKVKFPRKYSIAQYLSFTWDSFFDNSSRRNINHANKNSISERFFRRAWKHMNWMYFTISEI